MLFEIDHLTDYTYTEPVRLDEHVLRLTPRVSSALRVLHQEIEVTPRPVARRTGIDAEGNQVVWIRFEEPTTSLKIVNRLTIETSAEADLINLEASIPLSAEELRILEPYLVRESDSEEVRTFALAHWTTTHTPIEFAHKLNRTIWLEFMQVIRETGGPLDPEVTLFEHQGACRDFAVLMMDACRAVGVPARFVSGYQQGDIDTSHRHLHAWVELYFAHLGWVGFDPTVGEPVGGGHIALAVAARPENAAPVSGSFWSYQASATLESNLSLSATTS